jgi:hypothetical protein
MKRWSRIPSKRVNNRSIKKVRSSDEEKRRSTNE